MNYEILANVALEVAGYYPDTEAIATRAEWRNTVIALAKSIMTDCNIDSDTEDIDEVVVNYLSHAEALS